MLRAVVISAICTLAFAKPLVAQDGRMITGIVVDSANNPIPYVLIDGGPQYRALTNVVGQFSVRQAKPSSIELAIRRIGFQPAKVRLDAGGDTAIHVTLQSITVLLSSQVIRARQQVTKLATMGFYERMQEAHRGALVGDFVTPEEVEMRNPQRATQLLEQRRGVQVRRVGNCFVIETCYRVSGTSGCAATVFLDGQRLNRASDPSTSLQSAPTIDELATVTSISAIEVYPRGATAPPKFQSLNGNCAIVVIWTR